MFSLFKSKPLPDKVKREITSLARRFDFSFHVICDLRAALNGDKQISEDVFRKRFIRAITKTKAPLNKALWKHYLRERVSLLKPLLESKAFGELQRDESLDLDAKLEKLLMLLAEIHANAREGACVSCHLAAECDFAAALRNSLPPDPDKAHAECPLTPKPQREDLGTLVRFLLKAAEDPAILAAAGVGGGGKNVVEVIKLLQPDDEGKEISLPPGKAPPTQRRDGNFRGDFDATQSGSHFTKKLDRLLNALRSRSSGRVPFFRALLLAENFRTTIELEAGKSHQMRFSSDAPEDTALGGMTSLDQIVRASPAEIAAPDELVDAKIAENSIQVVRDQSPKKKSALYLILVDVSASMSQQHITHAGILSAGEVSSTLVIAILSRAIKQKSHAGVRLFASGIDKLRWADDEQQLVDLAQWVSLADYNGGGTSISRALEVATDQIGKAKDRVESDLDRDIRLCEILLVTDGLDSSVRKQESLLKARLQKTGVRLNTMLIGEKSIHQENNADHREYAAPLKRLSHTYLPIDPADPDFLRAAKLMDTTT